MIRNKKKLRVAALFLLVNFVTQLAFPTTVWALNAGPNSPEFSSFEPVATTDMVNPFTGDFTYNLPVINIPGTDGSGYPLSLSYHSGVSSEEEASWVGFGWTLNPGAINRNMRGFPDDYKNVEVKQYNKTKPNWSATIIADAAFEIKSKDKPKKEPTNDNGKDTLGAGATQLNLSANHSLRFNNYQGFSASTGFGASVMGMASVGANVSGGEVTFSATVNPLEILNNLKEKSKKPIPAVKADKEKTFKGFLKRSLNNSVNKVKNDVIGRITISSYGVHSISNFSSNISVSRYKGVSYDWTGNIKADAGRTNFGIEVGYSGNFNIQANEPVFNALASGYMYNPSIDDIGTSDNTAIVSDYYVEKASAYETRDHFLGMPFNNADVYSLTGEGLSGGFQLFHKKIGHYYPNFLVSEQAIKKMALEFTLGFSVGNIVDIGVGFDFAVPKVGNHKVKISDWKDPLIAGMVCKKNPSDLQFDPSDKGFFRFNNDLGGSVVYSLNGSTDAVSAEVSPPVIVIPAFEIPGTGDVATHVNTYLTNQLSGFEVAFPDIDLTGVTNGSTINFPCIPIPQLIPGIKQFYAELGNMGISDIGANDYSVGGSSFIDFNTFSAGTPSPRFEKDPDIKAILDANSSNQLEGGVSELSIHNEDGNRYIYGLPVYARNEKNFQVGRENFGAGTVQNNYIYYPSSPVNLGEPLKNKTIVGEQRDQPYATSYLLTQITTPDYVNIIDPSDPDGPTAGPGPEDFGGWTKFAYRSARAINNISDWYHYRTPYTGLLYQKNSLTYKGDDMGSVSLGEKQVYYLKAIETKTHIAFFITNKTLGSEFQNYIPAHLQTTIVPTLNGSDEDRPDGLGARYGDLDPSSVKGNANSNDGNSQKLEKLERIVLFAKSRFEKPMQTTHFEYDNSLVQNLPNSIYGSYPDNAGTGTGKDYTKSGKLTLRKVWFEYEGVVPAKISPYVFNYLYRGKYTDGAASGSKYDFLDEMLRYDADDQNPDYQPEALDIWGNYQYKGAERQAKMKPWVSQEDRTAIQNDFDPAAWQLKQIILPSGGEINIQYEEGDYCYVQDREAMTMVSLLNGSTDHKRPNETQYFVNLDDIGLSSLSTAQLEDLRDRLKTYFGLLPLKTGTTEPLTKDNEREKIYFKFLYALKGNEASLDNCKSEYIDGYTSVNEIEIDSQNGKLYFRLGTRGKSNAPKRLAYQYLITQKNGFLENTECESVLQSKDDKALEYYHNGILDHPNDPEDYAKYIVDNEFYPHGDKETFKKAVVRSSLSRMTDLQFKYASPDIDNVCKKVNFPLSYLRIPLLTIDKKGGGIRVKRILMYDSGANMETGDVSVFGTEYSYKLKNGRSSGVVTNEPESEENALKTFLPRLKQSFVSRMIAGRDRKQAAGPLGESLLPSPAVGYSRIVIRNIHTGKTGTGYKEEEYYTAKDFAFDRLYDDNKTEIKGRGVEYTDLKDNRRRDRINLPLGLFNYKVNKRWVAQGFRFVLNNMHGQLKKTSTYGDGGQLSTYAEYNYFLPGEKVPMLIYDKETGKYAYDYTNPGKEEQITAAMSSFSDKTIDLNMELDLVLAFTVTACKPTFGIFPSFTYSETELNTHTTTKVLRYPAILKSVTNYQDGIINTSEHLAFNPHNGKPVLTKTTDGYDKLRLEKQNNNYAVGSGADQKLYHDGSYYTLGFPASWIYEEMGPKSKTSDPSNRANQLNAMAGNLTYYGSFPLLATADASVKEPNLTGVIAASAQTFNNNWFPAAGNESVDHDYQLTAAAKAELDKKWRSRANYVFKEGIVSANEATNRIYTGGTYNGFNMFDWKTPPADNDQSQPWLMASRITKYSPHGLPLEETNILDIYSANRYGYNGTLVTMSAKNASYESIRFEDFENLSSSEITSATAHSGGKALNYNTRPDYQFIQSSEKIMLTPKLLANGAWIKIWVKSMYPGFPDINLNNGLKAVVNNTLHKPFTKIAQTGEWTLYEARLTGSDLSAFSLNSNLAVTLDYNIDNGELVYMDDFRFQPLDAQAVCFVYDVASRRLLTQFDDQHFGLYYQYNNEGKLVRKQIETERGMKTVQETQYNTPSVLKNIP